MSTQTETTVYITKYAISDGIKELTGYITDDGYFACDSPSHYFVRKGQYFTSRADAVVAAEKMRGKRISSLKKQIAKLEKMMF